MSAATILRVYHIDSPVNELRLPYANTLPHKANIIVSPGRVMISCAPSNSLGSGQSAFRQRRSCHTAPDVEYTSTSLPEIALTISLGRAIFQYFLHFYLIFLHNSTSCFAYTLGRTVDLSQPDDPVLENS